LQTNEPDLIYIRIAYFERSSTAFSTSGCEPGEPILSRAQRKRFSSFSAAC
jgi:hypothetical protein